MRRTFKKILFAFLFFAVLLTGFAVLVFYSPPVQSYLTHRISTYLSSALNAEISVGAVHLAFGYSYRLSDICVKDQNRDTLLYAESFFVSEDSADYFNNRLYYNKIKIDNAGLFIKTDSARNSNYDFLYESVFGQADSLPHKPADTTLEIGSELICKQLILKNTCFKYRNTGIRQRKDSVLTFVPEDMFVSKANARFSNIRLSDTASASAEHIEFVEKSGLQVEKFSFDFSRYKNKIRIENFALSTKMSWLDFKYILYEENQDRPRADFKLRNAYLHSSELALFIPKLTGTDLYIQAEAEALYEGNRAKIHNMLIDIGETSDIYADFEINNIKNADSLELSAHVQELKAQSKDILPLLDKIGYRTDLPEELKNLKNIYFSGKILNNIEETNIRGLFKSNLGKFISNITIRPEKGGRTNLQADFSNAELYLGKISGIKHLGDIHFESKNNLVLEKNYKPLQIKSTSNISAFSYKKYLYKNLHLKLDKQAAVYNFKLNSPDYNAHFTAGLKLDVSEKLPKANFHLDLKRADLRKLRLESRHDTALIRGQLSGEFSGDNPDNISGFLGINDMVYKIPGDSLLINSLIVRSEHQEKQRVYKAVSDFFELDLRGTFKFDDLNAAGKEFLSKYIPVYKASIPERERQLAENRILNFTADFNNIERLNRFFLPSIEIADGTHIEAFFKTNEAYLDMMAEIPYLKMKNDSFANLKVESFSKENRLMLSLSCSYANKKHGIHLQRVSYSGTAEDNTLESIISLHNTDSIVYGGDIALSSRFEYKNNALKTYNTFSPTKITLADSSWTVSADSLSTCPERVNIRNFVLKSKKQEIRINGIAGKKNSDSLNVKIENFEIKSFERLTQSYGILLSGKLSGSASIFALTKNPRYAAELKAEKLKLNRINFGTASIKAYTDAEQNMRFSAKNNKYQNNFNLNGTLTAGNHLNADMIINRLDLQFAQNFLGEEIEITNGKAGGYIQIYGKAAAPKQIYTLRLQGVNAKVKYLNTDIRFSSLMALTDSSFQIAETRVYDAENNPALFSAEGKHRQFDELFFEVNFKTEKFLALNTNADSPEDYYGKLYVKGNSKIFGTKELVRIKADVESLPKSELVVKTQINELTEGADYMHFVKDTIEAEKPVSEKNFLNTDIDLNLRISPETRFKILLSSVSTDALRAQGKGDLHIKSEPEGDLSITGDYDVYKGDYLFTVANVYKMRFRLAAESSLHWTGDPYNARADIKASYRLNSVKLYELTGNESDKSVHYPVNCNIFIDGTIEKPKIKFGVELGGFGEKYNGRLRALPESDLNKQFLSLLLLGKFQALPGRAESFANNEQELNVGEILSGQIGSLVSKLSEDVEVGFNYRKNERTNADEVEVDFSANVLNDRVKLTGNIAKGEEYRQSTNDLVGDFQAEIRISEDGNIKMKVFNKSNRDLQRRAGHYTQGIGFFYRKEFDRLFKPKNNRDEKEEKTENEAESE